VPRGELFPLPCFFFLGCLYCCYLLSEYPPALLAPSRACRLAVRSTWTSLSCIASLLLSHFRARVRAPCSRSVLQLANFSANSSFSPCSDDRERKSRNEERKSGFEMMRQCDCEVCERNNLCKDGALAKEGRKMRRDGKASEKKGERRWR
jgi:hypothetical protein